MKPFLAVIIAFFFSSVLWAQADAARPGSSQSVVSTTPDDALRIEEQLDNFVKDYRFDASSSSIYDTLLLNTHDFGPKEVPTYSQEIIRQRLYDLPTEISMDHNVYVQRFIDLYSLRRRDQVSRMLGLRNVYFPIFEEELDRKGMPMELKYLSIVESALNPHARSRVGATGLWQFMYRTGKEYGLEVNSYVDERKDPYKSTIAAMKYLESAHKEFGDWLLAIASYNCGAGNVRKAIIRSGGQRNFWAIREHLPRETRGYVPAFIAAAYVFEYAPEHNLYPVYPDFSLNHDTIHVSRMDLTLEEIAKMTNTSYNLLKHLNPELKMERVPYSAKSYPLRVPDQVAEYFTANSGRLRQQYGARKTPPKTATASYTSNKSTYRPSSSKGSGKLIYHTVRHGDVVGTIAERYGVSPRSVANWNNLRRYKIKVGQKLKIYSKGSVQQASTRTVSSRQISSTTRRPGAAAPANSVFHAVKKGETIWGIASQYPNVNVQQIMALNPGLKASKIDVGQRIRVK